MKLPLFFLLLSCVPLWAETAAHSHPHATAHISPPHLSVGPAAPSHSLPVPSIPLPGLPSTSAHTHLVPPVKHLHGNPSPGFLPNPAATLVRPPMTPLINTVPKMFTPPPPAVVHAPASPHLPLPPQVPKLSVPPPAPPRKTGPGYDGTDMTGSYPGPPAWQFIAVPPVNKLLLRAGGGASGKGNRPRRVPQGLPEPIPVPLEATTHAVPPPRPQEPLVLPPRYLLSPPRLGESEIIPPPIYVPKHPVKPPANPHAFYKVQLKDPMSRDAFSLYEKLAEAAQHHPQMYQALDKALSFDQPLMSVRVDSFQAGSSEVWFSGEGHSLGHRCEFSMTFSLDDNEISDLHFGACSETHL